MHVKDGGGITGLSSLLIIKEIITKAQGEGQQDSIPKPCELFDIIAGTGTGAISAVMLGRLRMTIDDAIASYTRLTRAVFSERKRILTGDTGAFKATVLERELKAMVCQAVGDENAKMMEEERAEKGAKCKVIVYAMSSYNMTSGLPIAFRSYPSTTTSTGCTIWETLRATTTHPQMFKGIEVDVEGTGLRNMFTHGGLGCTNPTPRLLEEAKQEYPDRGVASIISIGTGHPRTIQIVAGRARTSWATGESMVKKVMRVAHEMAQGSERVVEEMARRFADVGAGTGYFRLNVQQGTQGVEASEWERLEEIAAHTQRYLDQIEVKTKLNKLVEAILQRTAIWQTTQIDGSVANILDIVRDGIRSCPPSSPRFTGREKFTEKARVYFTSGAHGRRSFVLYGLGGAGKTQIALRCAEKLREQFAHIMFVDASSEQSIQTSLATVALGNNLGKSYSDTLKWIARYGRSCLLVLDNADDPIVNLQTYFPQSPDYNVMITTRCSEFVALTGDVDAVCNVSGLEAHEAVELLLKTAKLKLEQMSESDKAAMHALLESFGYLALAVVQAGAYIWKTRLSISQYWDRFSTRQQKLPEGNVGLGLDGYSRTVYTTWEMSLSHISSRGRELLFLISFLHRDGVVEEMFRRAALNLQHYTFYASLSPEQVMGGQWVKSYLGVFLSDGKWNDKFLSNIGELVSLSLITYDQTARAYSIHPLVQEWAQAAASKQGVSIHHTSLLVALSIDWGRSGADYAYKHQVLPHVNLIVQQPTSKVNHFDRFAEVYRATGQYHKEADLWKQTIAFWKQQLGEHHPRTLAAMSSLGRAYWEQQMLTEATELLRPTLEFQRQFTGERHPDTLNTMHNLAWALHRQDRFEEAKVLLTACVDLQKQVAGEEHRDTLESMDSLASVYAALGDLTNAETLRTTVIAIRKQVLGEYHGDTLEGMGNLASTYEEQGRLAEAEALYTTVVAARKRVLGEGHPRTLISMHELAYTYQEQGRLAEAEALYTTVVAARKRVLGEDHPRTLTSIGNLAVLYYSQSRFVEAEALEVAVLAACRRVLGSAHLDTVRAMESLEYTCSKLGKHVEADALRKERAAASSNIPL